MRIGIYGYGNLGKACEEAIKLCPDMKLVAVFTRRANENITLKTKNAKLLNCYDVMNYINSIDVMINCGGGATQLPQTTAFLARHFNVVDAFDNHSKINEHFINVDTSARENGNVALIAAGWEPGLFSLSRLYLSAFLPSGDPHTFIGKGISQGHSEAIRHIHGVADARQYTLPDSEAVEKARSGEADGITPENSHKMVCYVSADENAYRDEIEEQIKNLPGYFLGYDTEVNFTSKEDIEQNHSRLYAEGSVISNAATNFDGTNRALIEMKLKADNGAEAAAGILTAYARAVYRASKRGEKGCKTVFDVAPCDLSLLDENELRQTLI